MSNDPGRITNSKPSTGRSGARKDQLVALSISAACMAVIFAIQPSITRMRVGTPDETGVRTGGMVIENNGSVAQLAIETPRLVLGGFRGLLAMHLWGLAEDDKNERRWQALNTKYNIIGKLEPYFTSVYVFNSWNLAYNLSAQWHDIPNKYTWVLDGQDHLYLGETYNPNDPDIVYNEAQMYYMKLGDSFERIEYRQYWRDDIRHQYIVPATPIAVESHEKVGRYLAMPQFKVSLLEGIIDPTKKGYGIKISLAGKGVPERTIENRHEFYGLRRISPEDADRLEQIRWGTAPVRDSEGWKNYMGQLERAFAAQQGREKPGATVDFRYGASVFYFAYVEFERCLSQSKPPSTTGIQVVDSRPAMSFRMWIRDDAYYANDQIREMFLTTPQGRKIEDFDDKVLEIRDCFRNIRLIAQPNAVMEFEMYLHDPNYNPQPGQTNSQTQMNDNTHRKHIYECNYMAGIAHAESEMFEGLVLWHGAETHPKLTAEAAQRLAHSVDLYKAAQAELTKYLDRFYPDHDALGNPMTPSPDRADFEKFRTVLQERIDGVEAFVSAPDEASRKTDFLAKQSIDK